MSKYTNTRLEKLLKVLRTEVRTLPKAVKALADVEGELHYQDPVMRAHDTQHARCAEDLLLLGKYDSASSEATLIWHAPTREAIYTQVHAQRPTQGDDAAVRVAEALALGREVLA